MWKFLILMAGIVGGTNVMSESITVGGGCFWCTEAVFEQLKGVTKVESGYSGGTVTNPSYRQVCNGDTGHAEVNQITFDPKVISVGEILEVFFSVHDPTTLNRQGNDVGTQYRSVIFYRGEAQKAAAEAAVKAAGKVWGGKVVTEVVPLQVFYRAEDYHQEYFRLHGEQPYCRAVIAPKVEKFQKQFGGKLKAAKD